MFLAFPDQEQQENLHNLDLDYDEDGLDSTPGQPASFAPPNNSSGNFSVPEHVKALHETLLGDYTLPEHPPSSPPQAEALDSSQELTLKHYAAWYWSNGTVNTYKQHARVLQDATGTTILSLYLARKLAVRITKLSPVKVDICPNSCITYTGDFEGLTSCPHIRDKKVCGEQRYQNVPKDSKQSASHPHAQMMTLPVMASIRAMYSNETSSQQMCHWDKLLQ
ncbi:hypothetical protein FIBSPDRAFT_757391 [Athelia psychrophila]|uniref:Uncharacterized protein n=1 Tax=Athelia psychrophila TaxID=1759441 RepID=A0A165ZVA6_9AGAM|nr:hypothetical protein FIBSPDRAFT_757391 [Fibularhizoctonia sp. CBS 109695]